MHKLQQATHIMGIKLRTTNDNGCSFNDIPPFWSRFTQEDCAAQIPSKLDDDIYAVYTEFDNQGKNNQGMYSLIIGCRVNPGAELVAGFTTVIIPAGCYRVFPVEQGRPDKVGAAWQAIWMLPDGEKHHWRFSCEFERYQRSGEIAIFIGVDT